MTSMAFQTPLAGTDIYKGSFIPQTIRDWKNAAQLGLGSSRPESTRPGPIYSLPFSIKDKVFIK